MLPDRVSNPEPLTYESGAHMTSLLFMITSCKKNRMSTRVIIFWRKHVTSPWLLLIEVMAFLRRQSPI